MDLKAQSGRAGREGFSSEEGELGAGSRGWLQGDGRDWSSISNEGQPELEKPPVIRQI